MHTALGVFVSGSSLNAAPAQGLPAEDPNGIQTEISSRHHEQAHQYNARSAHC